MSEQNYQIRRGHPDWPELGKVWAKDGFPRQFTWNGVAWLSIEDDGDRVFIPMGDPKQAIEMYSNTSYSPDNSKRRK